MADGNSAAKSIERNKSQAAAAKYWSHTPTEKYVSSGFAFHERPTLERARQMAADNLRRQARIRPLPVVHL